MSKETKIKLIRLKYDIKFALFASKQDKAYCKYKCTAERNEIKFNKYQKELEKAHKYRKIEKKIKELIKW